MAKGYKPSKDRREQVRLYFDHKKVTQPKKIPDLDLQ
jgi:hypothetical protein